MLTEYTLPWRILGGPPFFEFSHVVPPFGREHDIDGMGCWCKPERATDAPDLIVHNVEH
jgi:hypothetical protein